jgi:hypothetical protein
VFIRAVAAPAAHEYANNALPTAHASGLHIFRRSAASARRTLSLFTPRLEKGVNQTSNYTTTRRSQLIDAPARETLCSHS